MAIEKIAFNNLIQKDGYLYRPSGKLQIQIHTSFDIGPVGINLYIELKTTANNTYRFPSSNRIEEGKEKDGIQILSDGSDYNNKRAITTLTLDLASIKDETISTIYVNVRRDGALTQHTKTFTISNTSMISGINKQTAATSYYYDSEGKVLYGFQNKWWYDETNPIISIGGASRNHGEREFSLVNSEYYGKSIGFIVDKTFIQNYGTEQNFSGCFIPEIFFIKNDQEESITTDEITYDSSINYYTFYPQALNQESLQVPITKISITFRDSDDKNCLVQEIIFTQPLVFQQNQILPTNVFQSLLHPISSSRVVVHPYNYEIKENQCIRRALLMYPNKDGSYNEWGFNFYSTMNFYFDTYIGVQPFLIMEWSSDSENITNFDKKIEIPFKKIVFQDLTENIYSVAMPYENQNDLEELYTTDRYIQYSIRIEGWSLLWPVDYSNKQFIFSTFETLWDKDGKFDTTDPDETNTTLYFEESLYEPLYPHPGAVEIYIQPENSDEKYVQIPLILNKTEEICADIVDNTKIFNPHPHLVNEQSYLPLLTTDKENYSSILSFPDGGQEFYELKNIYAAIHYTISDDLVPIAVNKNCLMSKNENGEQLCYRHGRTEPMIAEYARIQDGILTYKLKDNGGDSINNDFNLFLNPNGQSSLSRPLSNGDRLQKFKFIFNIQTESGNVIQQENILSVEDQSLILLLSYLEVGRKINFDLSQLSTALTSTEKAFSADWWKNIKSIQGYYYWGLDGNEEQYNELEQVQVEIITEVPSFGIRKGGVIINGKKEEPLGDERNLKIYCDYGKTLEFIFYTDEDRINTVSLQFYQKDGEVYCTPIQVAPLEKEI